MSARLAYPALPRPLGSACDGCGSVTVSSRRVRRMAERGLFLRPGFQPGALRLVALPGNVIGRLCRRCQRGAK